MDGRLKTLTKDSEYESRGDDAFDLNALLHPAQAFAHPADVVNDPDMTLSEKRAILASWASDACSVESAPAWRQTGNGAGPISFDDVMDALRALDRQAGETPVSQRYRRTLRRRRIFWRDHPRDRNDRGSSLQ
jgi:hypothetical protein